MDNKKKLEEAWAEAQANPGKPVDIGGVVVCDDCMTDYTDSPASGGIVFGSRALCPRCAPKWEADAKKYGEEHFIRARCQDSQSFADFVRAYRGSNSKIIFNTGAQL